MKRAAWMWLVFLTVISLAGETALGMDTEATEDDRTFQNFAHEAAVVADGSLRLELRSLRVEDEPGADLNVVGFPVAGDVRGIKGGSIDLLGSYGISKRAEVGLDLPLVIQKTLRTGRTNINEEDVGDLVLYGKMRHWVAPNCAIAGGLEVSLPTGPEHKGFGTGEVGMTPFVSTRYQRGRGTVGAHLGYQVFTGGVEDVLNYSMSGTVRGNATYSLRTEISARYLEVGGKEYHAIAVVPGIDVRLSNRLTVRPTGLAGLTGDAPDWGLGLGIALSL